MTGSSEFSESHYNSESKLTRHNAADAIDEVEEEDDYDEEEGDLEEDEGGEEELDDMDDDVSEEERDVVDASDLKHQLP